MRVYVTVERDLGDKVEYCSMAINAVSHEHAITKVERFFHKNYTCFEIDRMEVRTDKPILSSLMHPLCIIRNDGTMRNWPHTSPYSVVI